MTANLKPTTLFELLTYLFPDNGVREDELSGLSKDVLDVIRRSMDASVIAWLGKETEDFSFSN